MLLYFVRHGIPDYETDTLLPEGKLQAELVSERMIKSGVDVIYSSPMGRARETAQPTAEKTGLPVNILPWAYELGPETYTTLPDGEKTAISWINGTYWMQPAFRNGTPEDFLKLDLVKDTGFPDRYRMITEGLDELLLQHGYRRNANGFYDIVKPSDEHIALFCHCAMMRVMFSHLTNIPYQYLNFTLVSNFTGVTVFSFEPWETEDRELVPRLISYGDVGHIYTDEEALPFKHYSTKKEF